MKHETAMQVNQFLFKEKTINAKLGPEGSLEGSPFRCLQIDDLGIYLTTDQALQIAKAVMDQLASEVVAEHKEAV